MTVPGPSVVRRWGTVRVGVGAAPSRNAPALKWAASRDSTCRRSSASSPHARCGVRGALAGVGDLHRLAQDRLGTWVFCTHRPSPSLVGPGVNAENRADWLTGKSEKFSGASRVVALDLAEEPGAGVGPVAAWRSRARCRGPEQGVLDRQACEVAELDQPGLGRVEGLQLRQGGIQGEEVVRRSLVGRRSSPSRPRRERRPPPRRFTACFRRAFSTRIRANRLGRRGEKVPPAVPAPSFGRDRPAGGRPRGPVRLPVLQPIMPLDLPVKVLSWELTVYPRSHIRRWLGATRPAKARM